MIDRYRSRATLFDIGGRFWRIVLKKAFLGDERNFLEPSMRFAREDVMDHIVSEKRSRTSVSAPGSFATVTARNLPSRGGS